MSRLEFWMWVGLLVILLLTLWALVERSRSRELRRRERDLLIRLWTAGGNAKIANECYRGLAQAKLSEYTGDDYPREGLTVVLHMEKNEEFTMRVFAPGFDPGGRDGCIESYSKRPVRFLGALLDGFVRKEDLRFVFGRLRSQEAVGS